MTTYTARQIGAFEPEEILDLQRGLDRAALEFLDKHENELPSGYMEGLKDCYKHTMGTSRLLYEALVDCFKSRGTTGFPEAIYSIDLKTGNIETDKNGRRVSYTTEVLAPCTSSMLHYVNYESNDVYAIFPPMKSAERAFEKMVKECQREYVENRDENIAKFARTNIRSENAPSGKITDPNFMKINDINTPEQQFASTDGALVKIASKSVVPTDIFRLTITSRYVADLEGLIERCEKKFPPYIKFLKGERNAYKTKLSENKRGYFDIKKLAKIRIPNTDRVFYVEFQFKQTNMFFAHIRSHSAYEDFRVAEAERLALQDKIKNPKEEVSAADKKRFVKLHTECETKKTDCLTIHQNAIHQSNLYLMQKLMWMDDNARGLRREPDRKDGRYALTEEVLKKNYIVESYDPFDGKTAFATNPDEYLNKNYYLKAIGVLPESFDEMSKNAKAEVDEMWNNLTPADIRRFNRITETAIKYEPVIKSLQTKLKMLDNNVVMNMIAENEGVKI